MTIKIMGTKWTVRLLTRAVYLQTHGMGFEHSSGITDANTKEIHLVEDDFDIVKVRHELFHAYWAETLVNDLDLTTLQAEECGAAIVGAHLVRINSQARRIFKQLTLDNSTSSIKV